MKNKKRIWTMLVVLWMVVIFSFSAKHAGESSEDSLFVGQMIGRLFVGDFEDWPPEKQEVFAERINYPVRKAAHATEYAVLGALTIARCGYQSRWSRRRMLASAWGISTIYAVTDEVHQIFVPGRACMVSDMMIDSAGAFVGVCLALAVWAVLRKRKR